MAEAEPLALVTPAEGRGMGEYHFSKCPLLIRLGPVRLEEIWSHGEAKRRGLFYCPQCEKLEKKGKWRVKPATMPMPVPQPPPEPKKFFSRFASVYHRYENCAAWVAERQRWAKIPGSDKAFPLKRYEDREEAEMFGLSRCLECVKETDPDSY